MNNFQTILTAIFSAFFVFAVLIFSGLLPVGSSSNTATTLSGNVVIWGTFPQNTFSKFIDDNNSANQGLNIRYVQKSKDTYQQNLIEAFAAGNGPDAFFMTPDMIIKYQKFIYPVPYTSYPEKTFRDTFVDGASIYLSKDGVLGFPVVSDPLVLYYNKNILNNAGISAPPKYWDELADLNSALTKKTNDGTISQSMIALGGFDNINNAKDIISLLLLGSGDPIISRKLSDDSLSVDINQKTQFSASPLEEASKFFNGFSNQNNSNYSWNRALPNSKDMFTSGKSAFYIGHASELFNIQSINPNLSFDVTDVLQTRNTNIKRTVGPIYALAISNKSTNVVSAITVSGLMATGDNARNVSVSLSLPPVSRDLLAQNPADPYLFTFYKSAISMASWLDPDTNATDSIFRELVQNLISNKLSVLDSINKADSQLNLLIKS